MRWFLATLTLLATSSLFASPVITSVSPNGGPVTGGTKVVIRGTGFSDNCIICSPPFADPEVFFGSERALSVKFIDSTTVEAVTPPHLPAFVSVFIRQLDGSNPNTFTLENGFAYSGDAYDAFDPILFPVFVPPVNGAFGSEFHTKVLVFNHGDGQLPLYGHDLTCLPVDPPIPPTVPMTLHPRAPERELTTACSQAIGRLFFVPKGRSKDLAASIRVHDVTRNAKSYGLDIPVVKRDRFTEERISLVGVPIDPRFRNTLRIYGLKRGGDFVNVRVGARLQQIPLVDPADLFTPAIITLTDFSYFLQDAPSGEPHTITVTIEAPRGPGGSATPVWAFISVTNNETQEITTITPN